MRKHQKGFSLTELLIVVAIIGILSAIAIPMYLGQQTRAAKQTAVTQLQSLGAAMELYYQEHNNYGPGGADVDAIKTAYRAFKPTDGQFDFSVEVGAGGQTFTATCTVVKGASFGNYKSVSTDQNGGILWNE